MSTLTKEQKLKSVLDKIGEFYLKKNNGDYEKAEGEVISLRITNVKVCTRFEYAVDNHYNNPNRFLAFINTNKDKLQEEIVVITLARVGAIIGKRGDNIEKLSAHLNTHVLIIEDMHNPTDKILFYIASQKPYADEWDLLE